MMRRGAAALAFVGLALLAGGCAAAAPGPAVGFDAIRPTMPVRTLQEIRQAQVVRQAWDLSCGSAALSTLLTYDLNDPTTETAIIVWLLRRTDPLKIQSRGGFSLLDLKRFAEARGYTAEGYAGLTVNDLVELGQPAILPVRVKGYDHFVIFRGMVGDRVLLADPAFGNLTRPASRFGEIWQSGIGFVVDRRGPDAKRARRTPLPDALLVPDVSFTYRQVGSGSLADPTRRSR